MHAFHTWHTSRWQDDHARYKREHERLHAEARRRHRTLPPRARLLADLLTVTARLAEAAKVTHAQAERNGMGKYLRDTNRWLKQYHRLNRALAAQGEPADA